MKEHLNACHLSVPCLSSNIAVLVNKVSLKNKVPVWICFLITTKVTNVSYWSFLQCKCSF